MYLCFFMCYLRFTVQTIPALLAMLMPITSCKYNVVELNAKWEWKWKNSSASIQLSMLIFYLKTLRNSLAIVHHEESFSSPLPLIIDNFLQINSIIARKPTQNTSENFIRGAKSCSHQIPHPTSLFCTMERNKIAILLSNERSSHAGCGANVA